MKAGRAEEAAAAASCHRSKPIQRVARRLRIPTGFDLYRRADGLHADAPI